MRPEQQMALLRRFEPVLRFTRGEEFFPVDVVRYVRSCSLWMQRPGDAPVCLAPSGELTLDRLTRIPSDIPGTMFYLKLSDPLSAGELAAFALQRIQAHHPPEDTFRAGQGRLARVGYFSRFFDAAYSLGLLARGRVPGDAAAAAVIAYHRMVEPQLCYTYYGRALRQNNWIVLQYWFFYPFNNWRSGFFGANDHEGDWEMTCVYLAETPAQDVRPEWVAYAAHDYAGADLRRRWDDPELEKVGEHPVTYVGAGSHANYFEPGEYLTELELRFLAPISRAADNLQTIWHERLRQYRDEPQPIARQRVSSIFRIPFVDYARGDGVAIGPGQGRQWDAPCLLDPPPDWVIGYRGLWGLYVRDPFAGENAPAGPMYTRSGTIRRAWYDPVGWAGLDNVAPLNEMLRIVVARRDAITARQATLRAEVEQYGSTLQELGAEAAAMRGQPHWNSQYAAHAKRLRDVGRELEQRRSMIANDEALARRLEDFAVELEAGHPEEPQAHIKRALRPAPETQLRFSRLADVWAAASVGVMLIGIIGLVLFARDYLIFGLTATIALFVFLEAGFRGRLIRLVTSLTIGLAIVSALVLLYEFFWTLVIMTVVVGGAYILWDNLRELWS